MVTNILIPVSQGGPKGTPLPHGTQILYISMGPQGRNTFQAHTQNIDNTNTLLYSPTIQAICVRLS